MKTTTDRTAGLKPEVPPEDAERLSVSLGVLLPRIESITDEFSRLVEMADPTLRLRLPSDERIIEPVLGRVLELAGGRDGHASDVIATLVREGAASGISEENLPTLRAALQTAIAEAGGYTWTDRLERAWSRWFDAMFEIALEHARRDQSLAA